MSMLDKIKSLLGGSDTPHTETEPQNTGAINRYIEHLPYTGSSGFGLANGSYDNTYPSIAPIAEAVAEVIPIAINAKGEEVKNAHLLEVLNHPNKEMSGTDFREALITMLMVYPKVHLLVWHRNEHGELEAGGKLTEKNIAGLTFLEGATERISGGQSTFLVNGKVYTENEVLSLSLSINPYHLNDGYSPSLASKKWATIDDYIAEYHSAQFRNSARPAGLITIAADSEQEFNDAVDLIEAKFKGASRAGNIVYAHAPISTLDGKPAPAQISWTPFAQTNKDLTLEAIYNQANRKMENVFGVPEEVRGHLQNSNYASAEVADYIFSRRVIYPKLVKVYSKLTHELNRVTGGLGYALSFHYETPMLTDTRKLQAEALKTLVEAGFTHESVVEALRLPESYKALKLAKIDDNAKSALGGEAELAPANVAEHPTAQPERPMKKAAETEVGELPKPKEEMVLPDIMTHYDALTHGITNVIKTELPALMAADDTEELLDDLGSRLTDDYDSTPATSEHIAHIVEALDGLRLAQIVASEQELSAGLGTEVNATEGGITIEIKEQVAAIVMADLYGSYRATVGFLLNSVADMIYSDDDTEEINRQLDDLTGRQHWRSVRFGFTEQQLVTAMTAQLLWEWASREYAFQGYKIWHISPLSPAPCEDCIRLDGERVKLTDNFSNGKAYPPHHPNCYCYVEYVMERKDTVTESRKQTETTGRVERSSDEADRPARAGRERGEDGKECEAAGQADTPRVAGVDAQPTKITCPKCGRFLMDADSAKIQKIICPNSKCKARLQIDTGGGALVKLIQEKGAA